MRSRHPRCSRRQLAWTRRPEAGTGRYPPHRLRNGAPRIPAIQQQLAEGLGVSNDELAAMAITDPTATVKDDIERLRHTPGTPDQLVVAGLVYDVADGTITEVVAPAHSGSPPELPGDAHPPLAFSSATGSAKNRRVVPALLASYAAGRAAATEWARSRRSSTASVLRFGRASADLMLTNRWPASTAASSGL